ncbi:MAG TPA: penicillin-binding protein 2 [Pseudonocardiaceae bacterium]|jgi:cell division protein FtsI (penicillin-binding protein 3)|nr:penicillin-binding protein 2 [Pseudonocardiaceae bacterium]
MPTQTPARPRVRSSTPPPRPRRRKRGVVGANSKPRLVIGRIVLVLALVVAGLKLIDVQGFQAGALSAQAQQQLQTPIPLPANRGAITDRNGTQLAFSVDIKALYAQPARMRKDWAADAGLHPGVSYEQRTQDIVDLMTQLLGDQVDGPTLLNQLRSNASFVYLDQQVTPGVAAQITGQYAEIGAEDRSLRRYPEDSVGANIVGLANWREDTVPGAVGGLTGLESAMNAQLAGKAGSEMVDTEQGNNNVVIPGSERNVQAAVNGEDVQLTIDTDTQYEVQQLLDEYVAKTRSVSGSAVVMDVHTGQVYALANNDTFNPNQPLTGTNTNTGDQAVTNPFEPGSVNKIVTMAAALDAGVVTPDTVIDVPPSLHVADRTIHDDWTHGDWKMTVAGVFAKSSNIGTDELAQRVGPQNYYDLLMKMGLGARTGVGLPGESSGYVPAIKNWSGSTFANLPFGQGLSETVLQMAGMYQAIANGGVRVSPRIIKSVTKPDGSVVTTPQPAGVRVVKQQTADTLLNMMRGVTQKAAYPNDATGPSAALPGYQIAGKTGTAQEIDPATHSYSDTMNTVTFAGILSAENPRFVVGIMLQNPADHAESAQTAAPLFHDIAAYLAQQYALPATSATAPFMTFVEPQS